MYIFSIANGGPVTVIGAICILSHLILTQTLKIICYCPKFTELEIETQRGKVVSQGLKVQ